MLYDKSSQQVTNLIASFYNYLQQKFLKSNGRNVYDKAEANIFNTILSVSPVNIFVVFHSLYSAGKNKSHFLTVYGSI